MVDELVIVPANEASWDDVQAVFGTRGDAARCQCQRYKLWPKESWASVGREELGFRLRAQTDCGHPDAPATTGLVAYLDGTPVGWCAVEPRSAYHGLVRNMKVPWEGRDEDKADDSVWAVTCFVTRAGLPPSRRTPQAQWRRWSERPSEATRRPACLRSTTPRSIPQPREACPLRSSTSDPVPRCRD